MSSLWTPSGEHRVDDQPDPARVAAPPGDPKGLGERPADDPTLDAQAQVEALREQLAQTPAETVLANHCYGLFELGAIYLSANPPLLFEARLAIDAFGLLVEGLGERLGEASGPLLDALAQIRLGFVQVEAAPRAAEGPSAVGDGGAVEGEARAALVGHRAETAVFFERRHGPKTRGAASRPAVVQWTILARASSKMSLAPSSFSSGMSVLISSFSTTVSMARPPCPASSDTVGERSDGSRSSTASHRSADTLSFTRTFSRASRVPK